MLGDLGVEHISNGIVKNSTLQTIYLSNNDISDSGAKCIFESLFTNTKVKVLSLGNKY